jgi:hypothetical protein
MSEYKPKSAKAEAAIEELRNNVAHKLEKWSNVIQVSMAISPKIERIEGERWEEDGKWWEMRGGIKRSITSLSGARMPWWCPKCSKPMNHRFDRKFYYLRNMCYNCNIDFEGQMRLDGTYDAFEKRMVRENEKAFLRDKIVEYREYIDNFSPPTAVYEDGRYEQLAPRSVFEPLFEDIIKDADILVARLEAIAQEELNEFRVTEGTEKQSEVQSDDVISHARIGDSNVLDREGSDTIT